MKREREGDVVVMETVLDLSPKKRKREALSELFRTYSKNGGEMDLEGFIRLGQDLSSSDEEASSPEHTAFLFFLSYKMGCERFGHLQLDHFVRVSESLKCFHVEDFKAKKKEMLKEAAKNFEQLYPYVFDILQPEAKKYVEKDMAILALQAMWKGIPGKSSPHVDQFSEFLNSDEKILSINKDQWRSFQQFSREIDKDFSGYSEDDPWPSLFDSYFQWCKKRVEA